MKRYIFSCILFTVLMSCNDAGNNNEKTNAAGSDSTTQAPDGTTNSSAISTNPDATKPSDTTK